MLGYIPEEIKYNLHNLDNPNVREIESVQGQCHNESIGVRVEESKGGGVESERSRNDVTVN
jgi:hypothetical protein